MPQAAKKGKIIQARLFIFGKYLEFCFCGKSVLSCRSGFKVPTPPPPATITASRCHAVKLLEILDPPFTLDIFKKRDCARITKERQNRLSSLPLKYHEVVNLITAIVNIILEKVCTADCKSICNQSSECEVRKYRINLLIRLTLIRAKHSIVGLSHPHISAFYGRVSALGRPNRPYQKVSPCHYTSEKITYLQCSKIDSYELATKLKLVKRQNKTKHQ